MLHRDKAHGLQANDRSRNPVLLRAVLFVLFLGAVGLSMPGLAKTTVLQEVRMGNHDAYVRIVFEFSDAVQYQVSENTTAGTAAIRFLDTKSAFPGSPITNTLDCIDTVSVLQDGSHLVASLFFDPKGARLKPFTLQGPDRMVLDVFCGEEPVVAAVQPEPREPVSESQNPTPEPADVLNEPIPPATNVTNETPELNLVSPDTVQTPFHEPQKPKEPPSQRDYSQKYLLQLLGAITVIIVLLIALIIFQKRTPSESSAARNLDGPIDTDDMVHAIDTKIKEKLMKYDE